MTGHVIVDAQPMQEHRAYNDRSSGGHVKYCAKKDAWFRVGVGNLVVVCWCCCWCCCFAAAVAFWQHTRACVRGRGTEDSRNIRLLRAKVIHANCLRGTLMRDPFLIFLISPHSVLIHVYAIVHTHLWLYMYKIQRGVETKCGNIQEGSLAPRASAKKIKFYKRFSIKTETFKTYEIPEIFPNYKC